MTRSPRSTLRRRMPASMTGWGVKYWPSSCRKATVLKTWKAIESTATPMSISRYGASFSTQSCIVPSESLSSLSWAVVKVSG